MAPLATIAVFDMAVSLSGRVAVVVSLNGLAHVYDMRLQAVSSSFGVSWDGGGRRIAVSTDGEYCVTGTYDRGGTMGYLLPGGSLLWQRPDLTRVQELKYDDQLDLCIVRRESEETVVLCPRTGATISRLGVADYCTGSRFGRLAVIARHKTATLINKYEHEPIWHYRDLTMPLLGAELSPRAVFLSEVSTGISTIDLLTGQLKWKQVWCDEHAIHMQYSEYFRCLSIVRFAFRTGTPTCIDMLQEETGKCVHTQRLDQRDSGGLFYDAGRRLLRFDGSVVALKDITANNEEEYGQH